MTDFVRVEMARNFLDTLYGKITETRYTYLWTLNKDTQAKQTLPFDISKPEERAKMAETAIEENNKGLMVYFGVHLTDKPAENHKRAVATDITTQIAVITDIDIESAWHVSDDKKKYPPNVETAAALLPFKPSILVNSGGGIHAYNLLDTPLTFANNSDRETAKSRNEKYIKCIRQGAGEYSKVIDGVGDLPRVLQMVGCYNLKHGRENAPLVTVIEGGGEIFNINNFEERIVPTPKVNDDLFKSARKVEKSSGNVGNDANYDFTNDPPEYQKDLAIACLDFIDPSTLDYNNWFSVVTSCVNLDVDSSIIDSFNSRGGKKFNPEVDSKKKEQTNNSNIEIKNLIGKAQAAGFSVKDFKRDWYKQHTEYKQRTFEYTENKLAADEKAFEDEKTAAIEYIKNLQTFDAATVTNVETLKAAAFCKIFDLPTFTAQFWGEITKLKVKPISLNDLKAAMKPYLEEITARRDKLQKRRVTFDADKKSAAFLENNLLENFKTPYGYEVSDDGVFVIPDNGKDPIKICRLPLILAEKFYNLDDKTFSARLAYKSNNKWYYSPRVDLETISNHRKITTLSNYNLPITSANSYNIVEYLDAFRAANESAIPVTCTVKNCGWRKVDDKEIFIDPRRKVTITDSSGNVHNLTVEDSAFTQNLKTAGSVAEWRRVYNLAKKYPVARFVVAACVAAPLLEIFHERNFLIYILSNTTSGKTTALSLGVSAVGNVDGLLRNLDATVNGVAGVAADYNHYALPLDESEVADAHIKDNTKKLVYALANGVSRTKLNSDSTVKELRNWKTIAILTGETEMLEDNVTAGAYIRLMTIDAPAPVLPAELCKDIKNTICTNYGHALPLVIDEIFNQGFENLHKLFKLFADTLIKKFPSILPEYCRYVALVTVADILLNTALSKFDKHSAQSDIQSGAITNATEILKLVPKKNEISDTAREQDMISDFISANLNNFVGATEIDIKQIKVIQGLFGKVEYIYITIPAVKIACKSEGFKYTKVVADLIKNGFWEKSSTKILDKITRCYKIPKRNVGVEYETDCE